jgi:hypothetical protein
LEAFVASARSGKAAAPALQAENDALRRRVEELEARQAKLYPLVGDLFRTACEVANCAQTANRNKGGSHPDEISEVWTGAVEAMGAAIDALSVADEEFSKFLENHTEEQ